MPSSNKSMQRLAWWRSCLLGALVSAYVAMPAYGFTPSSSPLLSAGAVTPNVVLLVDNSGSMNSLIRSTAFNQSDAQTAVYNCSANNDCQYVNALDMSSENIFYSSFNQGTCASRGLVGYKMFYKFITNRLVCMKLPDPVGSGNTRYSANYVSFLYDQVAANNPNRDYTDGVVIPNDYRINVARKTAVDLVGANRNLRIGLATFNPPASGNPGPGGNIARAVADISATSDTTKANYTALVNAINGLGAVANTPLAETYYEVTRYFRGMAPYYNSSPSTYTSPIQYRCQKNYGVVITDGLPTYDRTFPKDDPLGGSNLPNWDGISTNDGNNINGDGEGDTLYLDDIAKFAYDIDMRSSGTDLAGKSWDSSDFVQQNMFTYTVGFTANNDMLSDAADYGKGQYYQATDAAGLTAALGSALNAISSVAGSGGAGVSSSATLTTGAQYYETFYDPTDWRGTIKAFNYNANGTVNTSKYNWSTDDLIKPGTTSVYQSWNTADNAAVTLAFDNFSTAQKASLNANLPRTITGADLVEWSKGTNKAGLKTRTVLLGDIINSPLVYASPTANTASDSVDDSSYSTYLTNKAKSMNPNLLVNTNDGFVNVISTSGRRIYAYMPSSVLPNLHYVADTDYVNGTSHTFLVDGQITVADAPQSKTWRTVALGGVGAGGKAFYALQLFDNSAGNTIKALWEIRAPDTADASNTFNDLGYAYAKPEVGRLRDGTWAAFISNGYGSAAGRAVLYVVNLNTGAVISKLSTPIVKPGETDNGLSSVKLRLNAQGYVQYAYGGDLKGRLWKFNFATTDKGVEPTTPLFTAAGEATQPITAQPVIGNYTNGRKLIFFGTGKLNESADKTTKSPQAFYAILDSDASTTNYTQSQLQQQTITNITGQTVYTSQNSVDYTSRMGWYMPLTYQGINAGERVIYAARLIEGRIYFSTAILDTTDPCSSSGSGKIMEVDAATGKMLTNFAVFGSTTSISGYTISGGLPNFSAFVGSDSNSTDSPSQTITVQDSNGNLFTYTEPGAVQNRRIMWRQRQ